MFVGLNRSSTKIALTSKGFNKLNLTLCIVVRGVSLKDLKHSIGGLHMASRPPCRCPRTMKWRSCWCPKLNL